MQPSSDHEGQPVQRSTLRRYGPVGAILAVLILIVVGSVVFTGGDDDDDGDETSTGDFAEGDYPDGVVTWSMAEEQDLDVEFPDTCDEESGQVAIPFFFRAECVANSDEEGGETATGVTDDEIKVVAWLPNDSDPIFDIIRRALGFDDTVEEIKETYLGLAEIFQNSYQTHGRTVKLEFLQASGSSFDQTAAKADAVEAANMEPFAVLGGPLLANDWTEELHARDIICVACPGIKNSEPSAYGLTTTPSQLEKHLVNYVEAKLVDRPAEHAGGDQKDKDRIFAYLSLGQSDTDEEDAADATESLDKIGADVAETIVYPLDPGAIQENATNAITQLKESEVTTVLVDADPITLPAITQEATKQDFFPEWVLAGFPFTDATAFGRTMDQEQWAHAFGISMLPPAAPPELNPAYQLYEWYHGNPPPADESLLLTYPQTVLFFTGVQFSGPNLTVETFNQAAFAYPPTPKAVTQPSLDYGTAIWGDDAPADYGGVDDMVELWWDPEAEGEDETGEEGTGMYRYVDGGKRYYYDEWPEELKVFDPDNAPAIIEDPPPEEVPPEYPSPAD